jgi:hypothetical protein
MRSSASARHISATPSCDDSENSWIRPWTRPSRPLVTLRKRSCPASRAASACAVAACSAGSVAASISAATQSGSGRRCAAVTAARVGNWVRKPSSKGIAGTSPARIASVSDSVPGSGRSDGKEFASVIAIECTHSATRSAALCDNRSMTSADLHATIAHMGAAARAASTRMMAAPTAAKNAALRALARRLREGGPALQAANAHDLARANTAGLAAPLVDRLKLTRRIIETAAAGCRRDRRNA